MRVNAFVFVMVYNKQNKQIFVLSVVEYSVHSMFRFWDDCRLHTVYVFAFLTANQTGVIQPCVPYGKCCV